ncbi:MAG: hypothetical protein WCP35_17870, partial [Verrucomicrobiota bacterium]
MNPTQSKSMWSGSPCRFPAALAALCLFAVPGVSRAAVSARDWYPPTGTTTWTSASYCDKNGSNDVTTVYGAGGDGSVTMSRYLSIGYTVSCTMNQTGGSIT